MKPDREHGLFQFRKPTMACSRAGPEINTGAFRKVVRLVSRFHDIWEDHSSLEKSNLRVGLVPHPSKAKAEGTAREFGKYRVER